MFKKQILVAALLLLCLIIKAQQKQETQIEEVSVAAKTPQQLFTTGKNVRLITQKDLQKYQGQSLTDVLQQVSGFQITGNFNNQSEPKTLRIRGGKNANVLILIDGVPLKDVTGNDYTLSDLRLMSLENVDSIEILNGASSVLYGSNATVSVINIKLKKQSQKTIEGLLSAKLGSFYTFGQNALIKGKLKDFNYQISGTNEDSDGFSSAKGDQTFDKDGWQKQNLFANFGYQKNQFQINLNTSYNHNLYLYDTGAFTDGLQRGNDANFYMGGNSNYQYKNGNLVLNLRYTQVKRLSQDKNNQVYEDQYLYKGRNFFTEIYNQYQFNPMLNLVAGLSLEQQSMASSSVPYGENKLQEVLNFNGTKVNILDFYVNSNFNYHIFHLDAGLRNSHHSKYKSHWVYSINPYLLKETEQFYYKLGYSFATAFIAPTLYQNFGSLPYVLPNANLVPETNQSQELDINFGKKDQSLNFNISLFSRNEKNGFAFVYFPDYTGAYQNVDRNKVKGLEMGFNYSINTQLKLGGNFSYAEKSNPKTELRQPKHRVNAFLQIKPFKTTNLLLSYEYVGKRTDSFYNSNTYMVENVNLDGFNLFNLNLNQKISKKVEVYLNIGNLLNANYTDVVGYTTKQRNFNLGFNYLF